MNTRHHLASALALTVAGAALAGCTSNSDSGSGDGKLEVTINGADCPVSSDTTPSGKVTFTLNNQGSETNEFEILAEDKLRIVGERENLGPGTTADFTVVLQPGTYYTACKPNMVGDIAGVKKFTVTDSGKTEEVSADTQALRDKAVTDYTSYVKDQVGALLTGTKTFAAAYSAGDMDKARSLYATTRMHYERIEPTAEQFGDIDPAIDIREPDAQESGDPFTGWHQIEKDLWRPEGYKGMSADERKKASDKLVEDTQKLYDLVYSPDFKVTLDQISNGATGLLEEVAKTKVTGEEEEFSHTDLHDLQANVEGAKVAFGNVRELAQAKDTAAVKDIDSRFAAVQAQLDKHRKGEGFAAYSELDEAQRKALSDAVNALRRPLASLTENVVG